MPTFKLKRISQELMRLFVVAFFAAPVVALLTIPDQSLDPLARDAYLIAQSVVASLMWTAMRPDAEPEPQRESGATQTGKRRSKA